MFEEDLDIFTMGDFGQPALIDGVEVWGIFDENYEPMFDSGIPTEGKNICFKVQSDQINHVVHGSNVELKGRNFEVINIKPIDDGKLTDLILKEK